MVVVVGVDGGGGGGGGGGGAGVWWWCLVVAVGGWWWWWWWWYWRWWLVLMVVLVMVVVLMEVVVVVVSDRGGFELNISSVSLGFFYDFQLSKRTCKVLQCQPIIERWSIKQKKRCPHVGSDSSRTREAYAAQKCQEVAHV
jgi:hypothetical protein